jgi:hypothetical protein
MTESPADLSARLDDLDARLRELEAVQELILRLMSTTQPLNRVLEQYGATESQEQECYKLLDELIARAAGREQDRPTFAYFKMRLDQIFPALRGDRAFTQLVIDTLKLERPAYRRLYAYAADKQWPTWS